MNVYGEVLFIENFITGWIILVLTARLRGYKLDKLRIATGVRGICLHSICSAALAHGPGEQITLLSSNCTGCLWRKNVT